MIDIEYAKEQFEKYVSNYDITDDKILLKKEHTYAVMDTTKYLCIHENINEEDSNIALLIALLHDIGRFEQLKRFHSFSDSNINHAALGVEILFKQNKIRDFIEDEQYDDLIKQAIGMHASYKIPVIEDKRVLLHVNLIRDSDKLDNFRVKNSASIETLFDIDENTFINQRVSKNILDDIINHRLILSSDRHNEVDMWVSYFAFIFDFNFKASFLCLKETDYLKRNILRFDYQGGLKEDMMLVLNYCQKYIENNCK